MLECGNQKQLKQLGFSQIWDPYSIGTEKAQNILQVAENKGWLPGMDSNHDSRKPCGMCNLQILRRPRLPKRARNTHIGTAPVQSCVALRQQAAVYKPCTRAPSFLRFLRCRRSWNLQLVDPTRGRLIVVGIHAGEPAFIFSYLQNILRLFCTDAVRIPNSVEA